MENSVAKLLVLYIATAIMIPSVYSCNMNCKWSNENCDTEEECYSGMCDKLHDGTDARCSSSPIHKPCFFSYQCETGLSCGDLYLCCSPYWGVCKDTKDCCDDNHVCRPEEYFTYKRCLPPNRASTIVLSNNLLILTILSIITVKRWT